MAIEVRRLTVEDAEAFRTIRLEALSAYPIAFQATYESTADLPLEAFAQRLQRYALFGGFLDGKLCGFVGFHAFKNPKIAHKGIMWGMYVTEAARGSGLAEAMVEAVFDYARGRVEQVIISVITEFERARHFYEKMGFETYGLERRALKVDGTYYDEEFRVRRLNTD